MTKKTITYEDFNGNTLTEDFYFNLTKAELAKMELTKKGGLKNYIDRIVNEDDRAAIIDLFEEIVFKSYGQKSEDGKRFIKSRDLSEEFVQTEAYSQMFMELISDDKAATMFINSVIPADLANTTTTPEIGVTK